MEGNDFYKFWFGGFVEGLSKLKEEDRELLLGECGKACSKSHSKKVYEEEYNDSKSLREFLARLMNRFPELRYEFQEGQNRIFLTYTHCACDLFTGGFVKNGALCDCSRLSLLHNWESVIGKGRIRVSIIQSILRGHNCCKFEIQLMEL